MCQPTKIHTLRNYWLLTVKPNIVCAATPVKNLQCQFPRVLVGTRDLHDSQHTVDYLLTDQRGQVTPRIEEESIHPQATVTEDILNAIYELSRFNSLD
jgi:hypothetical protein